MLGITTGIGYPIPFEFRYPLFKNAGFNSIMLWWGNDEIATRVDRVWLAKAFDLHIENAHASTDHLNALWLPGTEGNRTALHLLREISDAAEFGIQTLVLHLTNGSTPPSVSADGLNRIEYLVRLAEDSGVKLAFENTCAAPHIEAVLSHFVSSNVGLCYDSGHANVYTPDVDWLSLYKDRIFAVHLHDNDGSSDSHKLPFDGTVNWNDTLAAIAASNYTGCITLEPKFRNCGAHDKKELESFLREAFERGCKLQTMLQNLKTK